MRLFNRFFFALAILVVSACGGSDASGAPRLASSDPGDGDRSVRTDVGRLRLSFDREMRRDPFVLHACPAGQRPDVLATPRWRDGRTVEIVIGALPPETTMAFSLNASGAKADLLAADGTPLPETRIVFRSAPVGWIAGRNDEPDETRRPRDPWSMEPSPGKETRPPERRPGPEAEAETAPTFRVVTEEGSGRVLSLRLRGRTATALIRPALAALARTLDRAPVVRSAVRTRTDRAAQIAFSGQRNGREVCGLLFLAADGHEGEAAAAFDDRARSSQSLGRLVRAEAVEKLARAYYSARPVRANAKAATVRLRPRALSSGSKIFLPDGWRVMYDSGGSVDAKGPQGMVRLGKAFRVYTPAAAQVFRQREASLTPHRQAIMVCPWGAEPETMLRALIDYLQALSGGTFGVTWKGMIEQTREQYSGSQSGFLTLFRVQEAAGDRHLDCLSMARLIPGMIGEGEWQLYVSLVITPEKPAAANLPSLLRIWASWKVGDEVHLKRIRDAHRNMRQVSKIIQDTNLATQKSIDACCEEWIRYLGGSAKGGGDDLYPDPARTVVGEDGIPRQAWEKVKDPKTGREMTADEANDQAHERGEDIPYENVPPATYGG